MMPTSTPYSKRQSRNQQEEALYRLLLLITVHASTLRLFVASATRIRLDATDALHASSQWNANPEPRLPAEFAADLLRASHRTADRRRAGDSITGIACPVAFRATSTTSRTLNPGRC